MPAPTPGSYEQVLYPGATYPQSHPDRLATVARLFGLQPPEVPGCRVLELGCGSGENLLPLALQFPRARFHGVDLSPAHVELARASIDRLGLANLTIEQGDILALPGSLPEYDYVIAHGVYSWVPAPVRDALFEICRQHLSAHGVAYVSHNVNPGWRLRGIVRDALLFHLEGVEGANERLHQARAMLGFMCEAVPRENDGYRLIYADVVAELDSDQKLSSYLFHDILEEHNEPGYLTQFVSHAYRHELRFLAEADLSDMCPELVGEKAAATLAGLGDDVVKREQYLDLLRNRSFRQTLLCRGDVSPLASPDANALSTLLVSFAPARVQGEADAPPSAGTVVFDAMDRPRDVDSPMLAAALAAAAGQWPHAVPFAELAEAARSRLAGGRLEVQTRSGFDEDERRLREGLLELARLGVIELASHSPPVTESVSERPRASRWARFRIATDLPFCNLRNQPIVFADFTLRLLSLLDGEHDCSELVEALLQIIAEEDLAVCEDGHRLCDTDSLRATVSRRLAEQLSMLAGHAMLEA